MAIPATTKGRRPWPAPSASRQEPSPPQQPQGQDEAQRGLGAEQRRQFAARRGKAQGQQRSRQEERSNRGGAARLAAAEQPGDEHARRDRKPAGAQCRQQQSGQRWRQGSSQPPAARPAASSRQAPESSKPRRTASPKSRRWRDGATAATRPVRPMPMPARATPATLSTQAAQLRPVRHQFGAAAQDQRLVDQCAAEQADQHEAQRRQQVRPGGNFAGRRGGRHARRSSACLSDATVRSTLPSLSRPNRPRRKLRKAAGSSHCRGTPAAACRPRATNFCADWISGSVV
jgi:hypothetical protein